MKWKAKAFKDNKQVNAGRSLSGASDKNLVTWLKQAKRAGYTQFILETIADE